MTLAEMVAVVIGLAAGWWGISAWFARTAARKLRTFGQRTFSDEDIHEVWPELLLIDPSAGTDEIEAAWRKRRDELRKCYPAMMTDTEIDELERGNAMLRRAMEIATARHNLPERAGATPPQS